MSDPQFLQKGFDKQLAHLIEEIGETMVELGGVLAAAGKTQRWGLFSVDPTVSPAAREPNIAWLRRKMGDAYREIGDIHEAMARLNATIELDVLGGNPPVGVYDSKGNFIPYMKKPGGNDG